MVAQELYKPGGTSAGRPEAMAAEQGREGMYLDEEGNTVLANRPDIRMPVYVSLLERRLAELQDHLMMGGARADAAGEPLPGRR